MNGIDTFTREHLAEWLRASAPIEPGTDPDPYLPIMVADLEAMDAEDREYILRDGWRAYFDDLDRSGAFDGIAVAE